MNLNPNIARLVSWLNDKGFETTDSGDGMTHDFECDRAYAYVVILLDGPDKIRSESKRLYRLLRSEGVEFDPMNGPFIQANYSPLDEYTFLEVCGIKDGDIWPNREIRLVEEHGLSEQSEA